MEVFGLQHTLATLLPEKVTLIPIKYGWTPTARLNNVNLTFTEYIFLLDYSSHHENETCNPVIIGRYSNHHGTNTSVSRLCKKKSQSPPLLVIKMPALLRYSLFFKYKVKIKR
jgi:hypothetical protein